MEYDWVDEDGGHHEERETNELLLRQLEGSSAPPEQGADLDDGDGDGDGERLHRG